MSEPAPPIGAEADALSAIAEILQRAQRRNGGVAVEEASRQVVVENAAMAVRGLRTTTSVTELAHRVPAEARRIGFTRVLFSRIRSGTWLPCSAYIGYDGDSADALISAGTANPRRLAGLPLEREMVRRRQPILVRRPCENPRVHPELIAVTHTRAYVAAPVFSWGQAIGMIHADRPLESNDVDEFDSQLLGAFAESVGIAFERNMMVERLRFMREASAEHLKFTNSLASDFTLEDIDLARSGTELAKQTIDNPGGRPADTRALDVLTSRELEVLRNMAAGKSNALIAAALFVTEGTVKSHVKHILRKLDAANRTDAVIKYHRTYDPWLVNPPNG